MYYFEILLFITGVVLLIVGYRQNRRKIMLTAAIFLFVSGSFSSSISSFSKGFHDGFFGTTAILLLPSRDYAITS